MFKDGAGKMFIMSYSTLAKSVGVKFTPDALHSVLERMRTALHLRYISLPTPGIRPEDDDETKAILRKAYEIVLERHNSERLRLDDPTYLCEAIKMCTSLDWSNNDGPIRRSLPRPGTTPPGRFPFISEASHRTSSAIELLLCRRDRRQRKDGEFELYKPSKTRKRLTIEGSEFMST